MSPAPSDTAVALRVFYLVATTLLFLLRFVPLLRARFIAYGSRATPSGNANAKPTAARPTAVEQALDHAASFQVSHSWFTHFYAVSVASSLFWGWQLQLWSADDQLRIVWGLMLLQGVRRLAESYTYTSSSKSTMWVGHWVLGVLYYLATNMAIWVELRPDTTHGATSATTKSLGWPAALLVPGILSAHVLQHTYHAYLYALRSQNAGYQLPSHPLFPNLICPHYTCECAIYVLLSFLAAPSGSIVNWTMVTVVIFVVANLGVTADETRTWYADKFGREKVMGRDRMIPWLW